MGSVDVMTAVLASGLRLPYAVTGNSAGRPVVFVHAYVESWRYFEVVLARLPATLDGYAPTLRGHGDADQPAHGYLPADFAADIVGFMDALDIGRAALVGSSSGGLVAQLVAGTYPDRVSALVLISSPAHLGDKPAATAMWENISALDDPLDREFVEEFVRNTSPDSVPEDFVVTLIEESLKVPAHVWKETLRGLIDADLRANLGKITAPTLLIAGDRDAFVSEDQQVLLNAIPDARLETHEGVGHGVHLAHPEHVVSDIVPSPGLDQTLPLKERHNAPLHAAPRAKRAHAAPRAKRAHAAPRAKRAHAAPRAKRAHAAPRAKRAHAAPRAKRAHAAPRASAPMPHRAQSARPSDCRCQSPQAPSYAGASVT